MLIVITTAITYTAYSMNQITLLTETIGVQQEIRSDKNNESFKVVKIAIDNNQFNMTVKNTGDIPVHLKRLWIENTTDSTWPISKFDIDYSLAPGNVTKNIGQNIGLSALDTQSYFAQLISNRGNQEQLFVNSVGDSSLFLRSTATPAVMPSKFQTTVALEVINTGTTQLLNLQPRMVSIITPVCTTCVYSEEVTVNPTSFDSLSPGDTAIFEWIYSFEGANGDQITFELGLVNDVKTDSFTVTLQTVEQALNANVSLESGGLNGQALLGDGVLVFHKETDSFDGGTAYQMYSGSPDGGGTGDRITLDNETPHFVTNNGTANRVPAGDWEFALTLSSEAVADSVNTNYDMIFHFEDGDDPTYVENSEGNTNRNLEGCGEPVYEQEISNGDNDAGEKVSNGDVKKGDKHLDLAYDGGGNQEKITAVRFDSINVDSLTTIVSSYVQFQAKEADSGTVQIRIYGNDVDNADDFNPEPDYLLSDLVKTTAYVDWTISSAWVKDDVNAATTTPNLAPVIQEIIDRAGWSNGNAITLIFVDNGSGGTNRKAYSANEAGATAPSLNVNWSDTAVPDWQDNTGPHGSGTYYFDGVDDCFRSSNDVEKGHGNSIADKDNTTTLWFKTADDDLAISEEMFLVNWDDGGDCTSDECERYRILLTAGAAGLAGGLVQFEFADEDNDGDVTTCTTVNDYDDSQWYHITATRDRNDDECWLEIKNLDGTNAETEINSNPDYDGNENIELGNVRWNVGSNEAETGNFFKGWIDDIFHWNEDEITDGGQKDDHARTNFGDGAHQFLVYVDRTDEDGVLVLNEYTSATPLETTFSDPKGGGDNDDYGYSQVNMTINLPEVNLLETERLDVYFAWQTNVDSSWEELRVDMKIDDSDFSPVSSFLQIPEPDESFPTYFEHDPLGEFQIFVSNTGDDGIFLIYQGTRINFNGTLGSYAGPVHLANGTEVKVDRDSKHIPPGDVIVLDFYQATNTPSKTGDGIIMPDGKYDTAVWINGYTDQGESFNLSVVIGNVLVITP